MTKKEIKLLIGIYSALASMLGIIIPVSVLNEISQTFPEIPGTLVQMLVSAPTLFSVAGNLASSACVHRVHKKTISVACMVLFIVGGVFPFFLHGSFWCLMASTVLIGFAMGGVQNSSTALICDYFDGDKRALAMGMMSVFIGIGGTVYTFVASRLGAIRWHYAYLTFLCLIPLLILQLIFMPTGALEAKPEKGTRGKVPARVLWICLFAYFLYTVTQTFNSNISMLIAERGIGAVSEAGTATSVYTVFVIIAGLLLVPFMKVFKGFSQTGIFALALLGSVLLLRAGSLPAACIGSAVMALGYGMFTPFMNQMISVASPSSGLAFNLALGATVGAFGQSLSPVVTGAAANLIGGGISQIFIVGIIIAIVFGAVSAIVLGRDQA